MVISPILSGCMLSLLPGTMPWLVLLVVVSNHAGVSAWGQSLVYSAHGEPLGVTSYLVKASEGGGVSIEIQSHPWNSQHLPAFLFPSTLHSTLPSATTNMFDSFI